eukprot:4829074-Prymnesium_polylepis.1
MKTFSRPYALSCGAIFGPLPYDKKFWMPAPRPAALNHSRNSSPPIIIIGIWPPPACRHNRAPARRHVSAARMRWGPGVRGLKRGLTRRRAGILGVTILVPSGEKPT